MLKPKLFTTLKDYDTETFLSDLSAGLIVVVVALPLSIAFAIASGVGPERGLFTAIVAGFLISFLGGSRVQIGGPSGTFVVIVYGIVQQYGYPGLMTATIMAGIILVGMGILRMGGLIQFIPYTIITGFTAGIAVIIFTTQIGDALGLTVENLPGDFIGKIVAYARSLDSLNWTALGLTLSSLLVIVFWPRVNLKIPGSLVAIVAATLAVQVLDLPVETIGTRFGAIPTAFPEPIRPDLSWPTLRAMFSPAVTIALLVAIESLLSAVVADGIIGGRHRSNMELIAQGVANIASPFFGGIPATGAIARTAANVNNGAKTPMAGIIHALALLFIMVFFGRYAVYIPMPALAAILIFVAYNMSEIHAFKSILRSQKSDGAVLLATFFITIFIDISVAIQTGMVLAAFLFMKKMIDVSAVKEIREGFADNREEDRENLAFIASSKPKDVFIYEIDGPFFFGSVQKLERALKQTKVGYSTFILRMRNANYIDADGVRAIEGLYKECASQGRSFLISGIRPQPRKILERTGLLRKIGEDRIFPSIEAALAFARDGEK